ncbi:PRC-barrel domain-containing protein [Candidatus Saccharibacteria bacterium]|nr:PRC-barrel domain-containing protein [Candidatus Saccharibacteria bacterium]
MLVIGSGMIGNAVLSLHVGGPVAQTTSAIIDPEDLRILAYTVDGPIIKNDPEVGNILVTEDIRELSRDGMIIDSTDIFVNREDIVHLDEVMNLNFDLIGLKVVTPDGKKIGKIVDYTFDSTSFMVYQLIVQKPIGFASFGEPQLTINRSQIVEIDDYKVTIKHGKEQVKVEEKHEGEEPEEAPKREYVNPFRKPAYEQSDSDDSDNASETSE